MYPNGKTTCYKGVLFFFKSPIISEIPIKIYKQFIFYETWQADPKIHLDKKMPRNRQNFYWSGRALGWGSPISEERICPNSNTYLKVKIVLTCRQIAYKNKESRNRLIYRQVFGSDEFAISNQTQLK